MPGPDFTARRHDAIPRCNALRRSSSSTEKISGWFSRDGGLASPLGLSSGEESIPRLARWQNDRLRRNYDGNNDLYTISVDGGSATRVTYHPSNELLCDWTPDGKLIYSRIVTRACRDNRNCLYEQSMNVAYQAGCALRYQWSHQSGWPVVSLHAP